MAFNRQDMARVASASTGAQANWLYRTTDNIITVLDDNYFVSAFTDLRVDDLIQVKTQDRYFFVSIISVSRSEVITLNVTMDKRAVLFGASFNNQIPVAVDSPIQVEFGPSVLASDGSVSLSTNGDITFLITDIYSLVGLFEYNRQSSGGVTLAFLRATLNGVQLGNSIAIEANTSSQTQPLQFLFEAVFTKGDVLKMEFYRDSTGFDDGELRPQNSAIGWNSSPSASVRIAR